MIVGVPPVTFTLGDNRNDIILEINMVVSIIQPADIFFSLWWYSRVPNRAGEVTMAGHKYVGLPLPTTMHWNLQIQR